MANKNGLKTYEELEFTDDFLFCKILQSNLELCKELTEMIIGREIGEIVQLNKQHAIEITADSHGVRFDVYLKDDRNTLVDIEMQTVFYPELPRRSRYYQSMMDLEVLERGERYQKLPQSYVIFICLENPFEGHNLHKYSFRNICLEDDRLELQDGTEKIFLSAEGDADDVSVEMKNFLSYLTGHKPGDEFTQKIEGAVRNAKMQRDWSAEYMTLYEKLEKEHEAGLKEGRIKELVSLVQDGILTRDAAAGRAESKYGITPEDFIKELEERGI